MVLVVPAAPTEGVWPKFRKEDGSSVGAFGLGNVPVR